MSQRTANRIVAGLVVAAVVMSAASVWFLVVNRPSYDSGVAWAGEGLHLVVGIIYTGVGALVVVRRAGNRLCWLLLAVGLAILIGNSAKGWAIAALDTHPGWLPGGRFMAWLGHWPTQLFLPGGLALLLMLFPEGRLPSPRWRALAWLTVLLIALGVLSAAFQPQVPLVGGGQAADENVDNPLSLAGIATLSDIGGNVSFLIGFVIVLVASGAVFVRVRRASGDLRLQLKWLGYFAVLDFVLVTCMFLAFLLLAPTSDLSGVIVSVTAVVVAAGIPVSVAIAVLRYGLYDIDVVINRSLVYGALAGFITAVYVAVVVGIGTLVGSGGQPNLALSILATAVVAVGFQPARERLQRLANRLVYGRRATPYDVLSQFARRVGDEYATDEVLPRIAQALVEGSGAARAAVYLRLGSELTLAATWPDDHQESPPGIPVRDGELPDVPGVDRAVAVRHQGELLGALAVTKPTGEPLTTVEDELLRDLASQAGVLLRNVRLTAELRRRLEEISAQAAELRRSRQRIVAAQDGERRRLERNIHDGAQQHLVALTVKLRLVGMLAARDPQKAQAMLRDLQTETATALETLRTLAAGIYPPLLRDQGPAAALQAHSGVVAAQVEIDAAGLRRHPLELEAAVYFCCLEALQNAAKYARATRTRVRLEETGDELHFTVTDDGHGFDPAVTPRGSGLQNMADRVAAFGGEVTIDSVPGRGTEVSGRVPLAREPMIQATRAALQASTS